MAVVFPDPEACVLVVVDIQDRLCRAMPELKKYLPNMVKAVRAAAELGVPSMVTEQYPKGLGETLPEIRQTLPAASPSLEKVSFSCWGADGFAETLARLAPEALVLLGMETHVCVQQTAVEAVSRGYPCILLQDAVCSRKPEDRAAALLLMRNRGVTLTSVEALVFDWLTSSRHPAFKVVSALFKG